MYCENCGNKIQDGYKFCTKCGNSTDGSTKGNVGTSSKQSHSEAWWFRLLKVLYIVLYLPLLIIVPFVWSTNSSSYSYYGNTDTTGQAFWYSLLTLLVYMVIVRLIKLATLYIAVGRKPEWKKEFKKLF